MPPPDVDIEKDAKEGGPTAVDSAKSIGQWTAIFREAYIGQLINYLSKGKLLPYPEDLEDFHVPENFLMSPEERVKLLPLAEYPREELRDLSIKRSQSLKQAQEDRPDDPVFVKETHDGDYEEGMESTSPSNPPMRKPVTEDPNNDPYLVTWYGADDPENPKNWPFGRKAVVFGLLCFLTTGCYIGSSNYSVAVEGLMAEFHYSEPVIMVGMTTFLAGIGVGCLIAAPIEAVYFIGRLPIYAFGVVILFLFSIGTFESSTFAGVVITRFFASFFGSSPLGTSPGSIVDMSIGKYIPLLIGSWGVSAAAGPALGPPMVSYATMLSSWKWIVYELLIWNGAGIVLAFLLLPETLEAKILHARANRLRKRLNNPNLFTYAELQAREFSPIKSIGNSIKVTCLINMEPIVLFMNLYVGLIYSILYLWFEAEPITFGEVHHQNIGVIGLTSLSLFVSSITCLFVFIFYVKYRLWPYAAKNRGVKPEFILELAVFSAPFAPISLFIYGWTTWENVTMWAPLVGMYLFIPTVFFMFMGIFNYLSMSFPQHAASTIAGNAFVRCLMASAFPIFGQIFFHNLSVGGGCSLLAGIDILLIFVLVLIKFKGEGLRKKSKFAPKQ